VVAALYGLAAGIVDLARVARHKRHCVCACSLISPAQKKLEGILGEEYRKFKGDSLGLFPEIW
jgi:hypothetical protein